tara:strand:+ start:692 stop:1243 length:552 start_codon:yes stop_codon:yes gene_type:complete
MKKYFLIYITMVLASCGGPQGIIVSEADKETFKKNYEAFEKYHLGGIYAEDIDLFLELYSDSLKWSGPNNYSGTYQTKAELTAAATGYFNQFEEFKFEPGVGPDNPGSYWGGSLYSDMGVETTDPNVVRIYGLWSFKHSETGAPLKLKFYIIQQFNEAGKVVMLNEWFDPSSIETQIQDYLEN